MNKKTLGLRHLALWVSNMEDCVKFYVEILGMEIVWQPDPDNVYLTTGYDNLALHRASPNFNPNLDQQILDHFGFFLSSEKEVDDWHDYMVTHLIRIKAKPKTHRDGARSFYCTDPAGNVIQMIYHPKVSS